MRGFANALKKEYGSMCKISVVIPVYNAEVYLQQCLDSLRVQTLKEFEVICVDDGSTDASYDILKEYSAKDSRFAVIHQDNTGAGAARNNGFAHAKGEYVVFLDCDDFFAENFLEKTWKEGVKKKADIILFCARTYDNKTGKFGPEHDYLRTEFLPQKEVFCGDDIPSRIFVATSPAPWLRVLRSDFIREKKIEYENIPNSNDYLFTQLAMAEAERICAVQEDFVFYRVNNADSLQGKRTKDNLCFAQAVEALYDELNARGLYEKYRTSFIHSALGCFNDKIRRTNSTEARDEIFQHMLSNAFQRMDLLGHDVQYYGGNWLCNQANNQFELLDWYSRHHNQAEVKKTKEIIPRKSKLRPLVSVVIPMYNVALFLQEALDSICNQTLQNIEIICVNDGSTDETLDMVIEYAQKEPRMAVYSHQNSGPSVTRNAGLAQAKGKYVYFFDGDDVLDKNALSELSTLMERNNLDMALFDADVLAEDAEAGKCFVYKRSMHYNGVYTGPEMFTALKKMGEYYCCPVMYMLRTEFVRNNYLCFHRAILHEDQPFTLQAMMKAKRVGHIQKPFYKRRVHADSIMTRKVSFANVHGLFFGYMDMSTALTNNAAQLTEEQFQAFADHTACILAVMQKNYAELSPAQQYCRFTLDGYEPIFRNLAVKGFDESTKLKREIAQSKAAEQTLKKQLQKLTQQNDRANQLNKQLTAVPTLAEKQPEMATPFEMSQCRSIAQMSVANENTAALKRVQLQTGSSSRVKKLIKRLVPVTYNRSAFESQVVADLVSTQTAEILKQQVMLESNQLFLQQTFDKTSKEFTARVDALTAQQEKMHLQLKQAERQQEDSEQIERMAHIGNGCSEHLQRLSQQYDILLANESATSAKIETIAAQCRDAMDGYNQLTKRIESIENTLSSALVGIKEAFSSFSQLLIPISEDVQNQKILLEKLFQADTERAKADEQYNKQLMSIVCDQAMLKLQRIAAEAQEVHGGETMIFSNFMINNSEFSCLIKSSKRGAADRLFFSLRPETHTLHHDAIACALATMCGRSYGNVYLELTISDKTKALLEDFTGAKWHTLGSIPAIQLQESNKQIMLNFSGGFDSLAAKALLPDDTKLVAVDFGGWFEREAKFFKQFEPYTLTTNFRKLKYDREDWTFMGVGACLFAQALGAKYNVFGTIFEANTDTINDQPKCACSLDTMPFSALGLKDMRVTNGLTEVATVMLVTYYYPEHVQASLKSLAAVGSEKLYRKQVLTDIVCKRYRRQVDHIELAVPVKEKVAVPFGVNFALDFLALYELKYAGIEVVSNTVTDVPPEAIELVNRLGMRFYERLNTNFLPTIPKDMRQNYLDKLHAAGIVEYDENDWQEMREVRKLLARYHSGIKE